LKTPHVDTWYKPDFVKRKFPHKGTKFIVCYWCLNPYGEALPACPQCETKTDAARCRKAQVQRSRGYLDTVRENAVREKKDPTAEVRKVQAHSEHEFIGYQDTQQVLKRLGDYLAKGTKKPSMWERIAKTYPARTCVICGTVFPPLIPKQKYCSEPCRKVAHKEVVNNYWRRKHNIPESRFGAKGRKPKV
jgi:predicted nucleic acid-binding Zn ribbon protein